MIGAIGGAFSYYNTYSRYNPYAAALRGNDQTNPAAQALQGNQRATVLAGRRAANPEIPVEPVRPVTPVSDQETAPRLGPIIREGADPAEMAVRMRIRPYEDNTPLSQKTVEENLPGSELRVGAGSAQEAVEEGKCQTCEKRKYQDGSDDMGVSFQTPTRIAPEQVAAAVRGHENEHVVREQAKARQEGRKVVSQSVTLHTEICPECGKPYISGGTTRTVTKADNTDEQARQEQEGQRQEGQKQDGKTLSPLFG